MSHVWGGNVKIKTIFSKEEIEHLLEIYELEVLVHGQEATDSLLKNTFVCSRHGSDHFTRKISDKKLKQHYFVEYCKGAYCDLHYDTGNVITAITLLSDDYEGGYSITEEVVFKPKKGETVFYEPDELHGVEEVTSGSRIVYVAWYHK